MTSYEVMTNPTLTPVSHALTQSALKNNHIPVREGRYAEYTVQSPLHLDDTSLAMQNFGFK